MRYFFGFLLTIGLLIVVIIMIVTGGNDKAKAPGTNKTLQSYSSSSDAAVRLTIDGPINAASLHHAVRITVDRNNVSYEHLEGYDGNVTNLQTYPNSKDGFEVFLRALAAAGFTKGDLDKKLADERGYCPLGRRYIMELRQAERSIQRFWATSCGNPKSYGGNTALTVQLFKDQVPNYEELNGDISL
jgi:hypothetical protein